MCLHWLYVVLSALVISPSVQMAWCFSFSLPTLPCPGLKSPPGIPVYFHRVSGLHVAVAIVGLGTGQLMARLQVGSPVGVVLPWV